MLALLILDCVVVAVPLSAVAAWLVVRRERGWLRGRKREEIVFRIEALDAAICGLFDIVRCADSALAQIAERRGLARIEGKLAELKLQVKIYAPSLAPQLAIVVAGLSGAYDALDRLGRADPLCAEAARERLDRAVRDLRYQLDGLRCGLAAEGEGQAVAALLAVPPQLESVF